MANMISSPPERVEYLSTREAAECLGVAVRTVQLWVESGVLPAWKTAGGHRRIPKEALDALLATRAESLAEPLADNLPEMPAGAAAAAQSDAALRILVVEDDPALRMLFEMTLAGCDFPVEVDVADNGFSALLKMGERAPDVLITDLNMPGMDGFSMIRHLRAAASWQALPIVVVSALGARDIEARGGLPDDIRRFGKPVPFDELELLIRQLRAERRPAQGRAESGSGQQRAESGSGQQRAESGRGQQRAESGRGSGRAAIGQERL